MKKTIIGILVLTMIAALCLVGCGSKKSDEQQKSSENSFAFSANGKKISLDQDMSEVKEMLGTEKSYSEAASCAFEGLDKTYYYGSFYVETYPDGDKDKVNMIWFADDTVSTQEGISIGDSVDKVKEAYGDGKEVGANGLEYVSGNTKITFIIDNDTVSQITYELVH